jgi:hypothetical protein
MFLNELYELREIIRSRRYCEKGSTGRLLREIGCISTRWRATWSDSGLFSRDPRTGALERERFHDRCVSTINIDQARPMDGVNKARKVAGTGVVAHLRRKRHLGPNVPICVSFWTIARVFDAYKCSRVEYITVKSFDRDCTYVREPKQVKCRIGPPKKGSKVVFQGPVSFATHLKPSKNMFRGSDDLSYTVVEPLLSVGDILLCFPLGKGVDRPGSSRFVQNQIGKLQNVTCVKLDTHSHTVA